MAALSHPEVHTPRLVPWLSNTVPLANSIPLPVFHSHSMLRLECVHEQAVPYVPRMSCAQASAVLDLDAFLQTT